MIWAWPGPNEIHAPAHSSTPPCSTWILAQFGDTELVAAIDAALAQGIDPWMVMESIREAMQQRLEQLRSVVKA